MSLIPCRSCERPLSKDAKTCPNCGAKNLPNIKNLQITED
jgi:RNA polymerase subunit RPABC4/transcription elongation factor Spt4